ncbi:prisilkin-39-like [Trichoplusia ni]|uniref:Prisilkin-39-like n=1 Tax=Trichoplusia ni TaxID=7111 RepID=A0A7E5WFX6_TRINI|nr:prisilkin-39-like [Trichoplusia ni]
MIRVVCLLVAAVLLELSCAAPANDAAGSVKSVASSQAFDDEKDDLKTAASSGYAADRYSDWGRYPSSGVTGYGSIDSRYSNYGGYGGYDNPYGYNGYDGDYSRYGGSGYPGTSGYGGYKGGYSGYGYGGYGGYAGNGGLNSYYGYSNPNYQGANHLGYGYYKRPGYGNIYSSGITPSLVTGYRGYSRK